MFPLRIQAQHEESLGISQVNLSQLCVAQVLLDPPTVTEVHRAHSALGPINAGQCQESGLGSADGSIYPCLLFCGQNWSKAKVLYLENSAISHLS